MSNPHQNKLQTGSDFQLSQNPLKVQNALESTPEALAGIGTETGQRWTLILRAEPDPVPAYCRLRRFLKAALRAYGLRCTRIEEIHAPKLARLGDVCREALADLTPTPEIPDSTSPPPTAPMCGCGDNTPEKSGRNGRP